ncbi:MAG: methyl-accepting chemotaxis protein [Clostridiaceae bacterium]
MKLNLRQKITLIMVTLITIPMISIGILSYFNSSKALQSSTEQQLNSTINDTASIINNELNSLSNYVHLIALNKMLVNIAESGNANEESRKETNTFLKGLLSENSSFLESIAVVGKDGKVVVDDQSLSPDTDINDREYFKSAISGNEVASEVITSKTTGNLVIVVAAPLKSENNILGIVFAAIKFSALTDYVSKIKIGDSGYAYMIDKTGLVVNHPVKDKILKENASETDNIELKSLITKMMNGESGQGYYTYEGVKKFVAYAPASNWTVVVTAPYNEYMKPAINIRNITIIFVLIFSVVASVIAFIFSFRSIVNPIKSLENKMLLAGQGDLSVRSNIKTGDEIEVLSDSFNKMLGEQEQIVKKVREGAKELTSSSDEMAASSEEISAASQEIAVSIQEVAEYAENQNQSVIMASEVLVQLSSQVQIAQVKAVSANKSAASTKDAAENGRQRVDETVKAMKIINSSTHETAEILKNVNELSSKVEKIVVTINSIAEQTNLLALNAAIEAARAGEHGRGFTVVADEVRKLSEESNAGSKEINGLINEMVRNIENAVLSMDNAIDAVNNGVVVVNDTDKSLINIINAAKKIDEDIKEIVDITNDEVSTSEKIIDIIDAIGTSSEKTSSNSESVASASQEQTATVETLASIAEEVSLLATTLEEMVGNFKVSN